MSFLNLEVEFGGGLELLFSKQRSHSVRIPANVPLSQSLENPRPADVTFLIHWLRDNLLKERVDLFMEGNFLRPGILVLINDTDWELEGEGNYILREGDVIVLISTLHGG